MEIYDYRNNLLCDIYVDDKDKIDEADTDVITTLSILLKFSSDVAVDFSSTRKSNLTSDASPIHTLLIL